MIFITAILETMWGDRAGEAARYFRISKDNFSGRRLYSLCGSNTSLLVTNACRERVTSAKQHGVPDPTWLKENLVRITNLRKIDVILACGRTAQRTLEECDYLPPEVRVLYIPHPAARNTWTLKLIAAVQKQIQEGTSPLWKAEPRSKTA